MPMRRGRDDDRLEVEKQRHLDISRFGNFSTQHHPAFPEYNVFYTPPDVPHRRLFTSGKDGETYRYKTEPEAAKDAESFHKGGKEAYVLTNPTHTGGEPREELVRVDNGRPPASEGA